MPKLSVLSICCPLAVGLFVAAQFLIGFADAWHAIAWALVVSSVLTVTGLCFAVASLIRREKWRLLSYSALALNLWPAIYLVRFWAE
jgi:hypothetical protein